MTRARHLSLRNLLPWFLIAAVCLGNSLGAFGQTRPSGTSQLTNTGKNSINPHTGQSKPSPEAAPYSTKMTTQRSYYDPPNEDKVKMEVTGDLTNVAAGVLVTNAEIRNYSLAGGPPQLTVDTPECIVDTALSQISSASLLQAHSGDSNFYVEGVGFLWQQNATPDLILSNRVHTIIHQLAPANAAPGKTNSAPSETHVYSESATFDTKAGLIIYREHIRVVDPQLHLTSAILTVQLTQGSAANQLDHIVAETNVIIDYFDESGRKTHATSDKAVYTRLTDPATNELLTLSGNPRVETTNGWSTADVFVMNRTTGKIQGSGNCLFHHEDPAPAGGDATNTPVTEITADNFDYDMKTGVIVFRDHVRVDNPQLKLVCDILTAKLPEGDARTNDLQNIVAESNVAMDYLDAQGETTHATAERAVYTSSVTDGVTNKVLDLTGNPVLERTNGWIMADLITMDQLNGTIRAEGNHHTIFKKQSGQVSKTAPPAAADTEIFSDHFDFNHNTGVAFYRGNARVIDPQMHLQCVQLMVKLPENTGATNHAVRPDRIVAETNVIVDYFTEKGEKTHATSEKMVFTHTVTNGTTTNDVLELTENPVVDMTNLKGEQTHAVSEKMVYTRITVDGNMTNVVLELTGKPVVDMTSITGEKTRATGDKVVYTSASFGSAPSELVKLSGHPQVKRSDGTVWATDNIIIYDRLDGQVRGLGQNHIHIDLKPAAPAATNRPPALSSAPAS